jgi:hypothetical protein
MRLGVAISDYSMALVSADAGDKDQAFEWLNRAAERRSGALARLESEPRFAGLRGDPRYGDLVARLKGVTLEPEEELVAAPQIVPPRAATGPVALWKRFLWPDIFNDTTARKAAAQGVWACAFIVAATVLASLLTSTAGRIAVIGLGWNQPLIVAVVFGPIAFGILKMGRPAAIVGLILCSLGAMGNLGVMRASGAAVDGYNNIPAQYRTSYNDPYPTYYYACFSLAISLACVAAFTNATRGAFAYRELVSTGKARDKQEAITREEWKAIREQMAVKIRTVRARASKPAEPVLVQAACAQPVVAAPAPKVVAMPVAQVPSGPVAFEGFPALIGVAARGFNWPRTGLFALANVIAALLYFSALSATTSLPVSGGYWLLGIWQSLVFSVAAVMAFRAVKNLWIASAAGAIATLVLILPVYSALPGFSWADILYREQFQQFILLPLVYCFIFLAFETLLVQRLQPLPLALWLGAKLGDHHAVVCGFVTRVGGQGSSGCSAGRGIVGVRGLPEFGFYGGVLGRAGSACGTGRGGGAAVGVVRLCDGG